MIDFDFLNILALLTIFCGVVTFVYWLFSRKDRQSTQGKKSQNIIIEYARALFPVFLLVLLIRAFVAQPYRVPSGSLEPTVVPGDFILVTQYNYGLKLPLWEKTLVNVGEPRVGQIALFRWPVNPKLTFVKRVIGVPGDKISYINKVFYINGKEMVQKYIGDANEITDEGVSPVKKYAEDLQGIKHFIYRNPNRPAQDFRDLVVPKGMYFMIGDNRDNSDDSRSWGFVPIKAFIGRARLIWMSWDSQHNHVRWGRIGDKFSI